MQRLLLLLPLCTAFYLPGLAPTNFKAGDEVYVYANTIQSSITDLPFDFYHPKFHFPKPEHEEREDENLGSALLGDRYVKTMFKVDQVS